MTTNPYSSYHSLISTIFPDEATPIPKKVKEWDFMEDNDAYYLVTDSAVLNLLSGLSTEELCSQDLPQYPLSSLIKEEPIRYLDGPLTIDVVTQMLKRREIVIHELTCAAVIWFKWQIWKRHPQAPSFRMIRMHEEEKIMKVSKRDLKDQEIFFKVWRMLPGEFRWPTDWLLYGNVDGKKVIFLPEGIAKDEEPSLIDRFDIYTYRKDGPCGFSIQKKSSEEIHSGGIPPLWAKTLFTPPLLTDCNTSVS